MAGRHAAASAPERRIAWTILGIGTVVSLASLFGTVWMTRVGVVLAIAMAFAAVWVAWSQLHRERGEHAAQIRREVAARTALAQRHHADSLAMIERFGKRTDNLKAVIAKLRRQLALANSELSSMRGNAVWLRAEVAERQAQVEALSTRLAALEAEHSEKLVLLPRRGTASDLHPSVEDIWGDDEHPTMVDIAKLQLDGLADLRIKA